MKQARDAILSPLRTSGETLLLIYHTILHLPYIWFKRHEILRQMYVSGFKSLFTVSVVALFTGMIIGLQTGLALKTYGQQDLIGQIITITLTREMSPFMSALILSAAVGSAMAAEIGTMTVSEEVDALEVMSIDPVRYLVLPRLVGFTLIVPVLATYATLLGVVGGGLVANTQLGVELPTYFNVVLEVLRSKEGLKDIWVGQLKSFVYGITIASISCQQGLAASGGAIGVGIAVRQSVVSSFLMVIVLGYFITSMFYR